MAHNCTNNRNRDIESTSLATLHRNLFHFDIFNEICFILQATVQWDPPRLQSGLELLGYKIFVDNKVLRGLQRRDTRQMVINDLVPGRSSLPLNLYWVVMNCQTLRKLEFEFYWHFIVKMFNCNDYPG